MRALVLIVVLLMLQSCSREPEREQRAVGRNKAAKLQASAEKKASMTFAKGEQLFNKHCLMCHAMTTEVIVGPGLAGITQRQNREQIKNWIVYAYQLIEQGDPYAVALYLEYNKTLMPRYNKDFNQKELNALLDYIENASVNPKQEKEISITPH